MDDTSGDKYAVETQLDIIENIRFPHRHDNITKGVKLLELQSHPHLLFPQEAHPTHPC